MLLLKTYHEVADRLDPAIRPSARSRIIDRNRDASHGVYQTIVVEEAVRPELDGIWRAYL